MYTVPMHTGMPYVLDMNGNIINIAAACSPRGYIYQHIDTRPLEPGIVPVLLLLRNDLVREPTRHQSLGSISDGAQLCQARMAPGISR